MAKIGFAFKSAKNSERIMSNRFPAVHGLAEEHECVSEAPYITRQTVAYAISLTVSALFYAVNDESNTGRADEVYDKALRDLQQLTDDKFTEVLGGLLQYYVQNVTSPEAPGPGTMLLSRQEVAVNNRGLGSSSAPRAAVAPAVAPTAAPDVAGAPADADAPPDASDASSDDASVAKSTSGSDDNSVARSTAIPKDNVKGKKKAGGPGRHGGGAAAGRGGAAADATKTQTHVICQVYTWQMTK
jgi:hypothetical protein